MAFDTGHHWTASSRVSQAPAIEIDVAGIIPDLRPSGVAYHHAGTSLTRPDKI